MLNVIGALVEHENGFSYPKYRQIVLLCVNKIFECMESPHFQVADQALSLWKDTVMLYLSKCQKDMIWRRLFIIFKDIELNHWNQGVQNLCKEVVVYYERIDSAYWLQLKEEYEKNAANGPVLNGDTRTRSNGLENGKSSVENSRTRSNANSNDADTLDIAASNSSEVAVPSTLVPAKYQEDRRHELKQRNRARAAKYKSLRKTAGHNKEKLPDYTPPQHHSNPHTDSSPKSTPKSVSDDDDHKDSPNDNIEINDPDPSKQGDGAEDTPNHSTEKAAVDGT